MPNWVNLANLFTLLRLLMSPLVVYFIMEGRYLLAGWLFGAAAFTDILDGLAARGLKLKTDVGAYFDPIADKTLLSSVFLALAWAHLVPRWVVWIIFGRDLYILLGSVLFLLFTDVRKFPPTVWGKMSTFVQICTAVFWMARLSFGTPALVEISSAILWPCVGFTLWSGLHYTWIGIHLSRGHIDGVSAGE